MTNASQTQLGSAVKWLLHTIVVIIVAAFAAYITVIVLTGRIDSWHRDTIVTYLNSHCELIVNAAQTDSWYECPRADGGER
jgi:hypothetical protein